MTPTQRHHATEPSGVRHAPLRGDPPPGEHLSQSRPLAQRPVPLWFSTALAVEPQRRTVDVQGAAISYRVWGEAGRPGIVLVHGSAAHSGWWDHIAPQLTRHRVVALDLSGHGDSGRRRDYGLSLWAAEVTALAVAEKLTRPVMIGHSLGGWVALVAGTARPQRAAGVVLIDSPPQESAPDEKLLAARRRPHRRYDSLEHGMAAFRSIPAQADVLPFVAQHIARQSLSQDGDAWTWKFDPAVFATRPGLRQLMRRLDVPGLLVRPERGVLSATTTHDLAGLADARVDVVEIPKSGHAPMLDRPLVLAHLLNRWMRDQS